MSLSCDIIIPTYNQPETLLLALEALFAQEVKSSGPIQIVISDDGSTDRTAPLIKALATHSPWPIRYLVGPHRGAAAARNRAVATSQAAIILFLGGDILLRPRALQAHLDFHEKFPGIHYAALGQVAWDPRLSPSPLLEWMTHGGPQNDFDALLGLTEVDPAHYFYGSHLSVKRDVMQKEKFSEQFTAYGWEDLELGRRLAAHGLILKPLLTARGLHRHAYRLSDVVRRQRAAGAALVEYQKHHPTVALAPLPTWVSALKFWLVYYSGVALALRFFLRYSGERWTTPSLFFALTVVEYWQGIFSAQKS